MPKTHALAAAIGLGWAIWATWASALDDPAARAKTTTLDNGLVVVTLEDTSTPVVSFQMWVKVGSRDEARYTGLAHLFEHMMFNGSKNIGPEEHANLITARGGEVNAYTSNDQTVYFDDVTRETLPLVIDLEYERLANLDISPASLDRERQVVLEERRMRTEDVRDLFAYLRTLPAVQGHVRDHDVPFPFNVRRTLGGWKLLFLDGKPFQPDPSKSAQWNRGTYLVNGPGHCGECHSPRNSLGGTISTQRFAGGPNPEDASRHEHERHHGQRRECEPPVEDEEHDRGPPEQ